VVKIVVEADEVHLAELARGESGEIYRVELIRVEAGEICLV
jgi:hypothetical protein